MAMPADTPIPESRSSPRVACSGVPSVLIELAFDQVRQRSDRVVSFAARGRNFKLGASARRQHHQPHDRAARNDGAVLAYPDIGVEAMRGLDEERRGACVQTALVADFRHLSGGRRRGRLLLLRGLARRLGAHRCASVSNCEATLMYLRPASCAPSTARSRLSVCRRLASLISIGRLIPAITSILARSITEIARFEGVPPNMSVSSTAPSPLSTALIEMRISWRRCSM